MRPVSVASGWLACLACACLACGALAACAAAVTEDGEGVSNEMDFGAGGGGASCSATAFQGQTLPLDLSVVLQVSGSMANHEEELRAGFKSFVESPDAIGLGIGLTLFPRYDQVGYGSNGYIDCEMLTGGQEDLFGCVAADICECNSSETSSDCSCWFFDRCEPGDYVVPEVEIAPLPGAAASIEQSIYMTEKDESPLGHAFDGATQYLTGWALNRPDQNAAIVLVADRVGSSAFCSTSSDPAPLAAAAASSPAAIRTYVIALGDAPELDDIASSGGSVTALVASPSAANVAAALDKVRAQARGCAYAIPRPSSGAFDPKMVNVRVQGATDAGELPQVPDAAHCDQGGWYYDDPLNPRKILLCHESCADLTDASSGVEVLIGCPTVVIK
jgi:hypothetical protein